MDEELKLCVSLCVHNEDVQSKNLPAGWILEEGFSLELDEPYKAYLHLYLNETLKKAVVVCRVGEILPIDPSELLNGYQTRFKQRFFSSLFQIENSFSSKTKNMVCLFTGFGPAGNLAQLYSCYFETHCFSINSPGNKTLLESTFIPTIESKNLKNRAHTFIHIFLTRPNPINIFDSQMGNIYRIKMPVVKENSWRHIIFSAIDIVSVLLNFGQCLM